MGKHVHTLALRVASQMQGPDFLIYKASCPVRWNHLRTYVNMYSLDGTCPALAQKPNGNSANIKLAIQLEVQTMNLPHCFIQSTCRPQHSNISNTIQTIMVQWCVRLHVACLRLTFFGAHAAWSILSWQVTLRPSHFASSGDMPIAIYRATTWW